MIMEWLNSFIKTIGGVMGGWTVGWVDFVTLLVICIGIVRGRKRGLSEELLDTTMWLIIVVAGALLYRTIGNVLIQKPILSLLTFYMLSYIAVALAVKIIFVLIKRKFGQKLVES